MEVLSLDESVPIPEFTAGPFVTCREPVKKLVHTLSELYISSEEDDSIANVDPQPLSTTPLPPNEKEEADLNLSSTGSNRRVRKTSCHPGE